MPRAKRTQAPGAPQDQAYGQRGDQIAAQRQLPLPDNSVSLSGGAPPTPPGGPAPGGPPAGGPVAPPVDPLAAAAAMLPPSPDGLTAPSERPHEPVTAGLRVGAGPGPEMNPLLSVGPPNTPTAHALEMIAKANGDDPIIADLARQARQRRQ